MIVVYPYYFLEKSISINSVYLILISYFSLYFTTTTTTTVLYLLLLRTETNRHAKTPPAEFFQPNFGFDLHPTDSAKISCSPPVPFFLSFFISCLSCTIVSFVSALGSW